MTDGVTEAQVNPATSVLKVGLALGGIVLAAVIIFALGVMEGSRVAELAPEIPAPPSALPTETLKTLPATPAATAAAIPPDKLTFYDRLSGVAPAAMPDVPPPARGLAPVASATPAATAPPTVPVVPARPAEAPAVVPVTPKKPAAPAAELAARTAAPSKSDPVAQIRKLAGKGRFTVQMAAVSERAAAAGTATRLKQYGFEATTVMASVKGKTWYRIRVESFPNKQAATQAAGIFHSALGFNAIPVEN